MHQVSLGFGKGAARVEALRCMNASFSDRQLTMVTGPSGGGKTTLLSVIGALIRVEAGQVVVDGEDLTNLDSNSLAEFRRKKVGFIFQAFRLIKSLSAVENVALSLHLRFGGSRSTLLQRAEGCLAQVGLSAKANLQPYELSGGEKQRVAVARALAHNPPLLLADEPTASLDAENGLMIMDLLRKLAQVPGRAVIVVSHDDRARPFADRVIHMEDGRISAESGER
jgi:putative ABC transport system ATP-binding protein